MHELVTTSREPGFWLEPTGSLGLRRGSSGMRKILSIQTGLVFILIGAGFLYGGSAMAQAAGFGGAIALVNTSLLAWRLQRGKRHLHTDASRHMRSFYASTIERFMMVAVLFAAAIGILELMPLAVLGGFIAGQLALLISSLMSEIK